MKLVFAKNAMKAALDVSLLLGDAKNVLTAIIREMMMASAHSKHH